MKEMMFSYRGHNYWSNAVYECDGILYADLNSTGKEPDLYTLSSNEFDGEPDMPIGRDIRIAFNPEREVSDDSKRFRYMMLDRMRSNCDYYLNYGKRNPKHLSCNSEKEHIKEMKELWDSFSEDEKPEWLTWEQILEYEKKMVKPSRTDNLSFNSEILKKGEKSENGNI